MIEIPFTKFHGAENDFLLTWGDESPLMRLPQIARLICARNTGIGADGWMLVWKEEHGLRTRLFNSDGSEPEISGNGTRCAAAFGLLKHAVAPPEIVIATAAGSKSVRLISHEGKRYTLEMNMGLPKAENIHATVHASGRDFDSALLNVGNPQCAVFVKQIPEDWEMAGRLIERHPMFPNRTNVSFVRVVDRHTIETVFFERGAGATRSSGTGSTGAAAAAILRGEADSPVEIRTPAGPMTLRWVESVYLTGPAELVGEGRFYADL